ncbi:MAG TPA: tartrate-resistant acid phosphatase type 5 family protein [Caulobacteraceae bacterium]|nr:tartrate-resistant acid phosphatase type 5 family protein [Caulobacteraceae bacterium]
MTSLSRRAALWALTGAAAGAFTARWARAAESALTFLAVGDWGRDGAFHQAEVAQQMGVTADAIGARFVLAVGDNFYEDGVTGVDDPKWKTSFEDIYTAPSLQVPWQAALGNHDYHGDTQAQLDYSKKSRRWRLPGRHYRWSERAPDGASADFFVLDTSPFVSSYWADGGAKVKVAGQDPKAQLAWFDDALGSSTADWKIVIGHHPIWSGRDDDDAAPDLRAKVDPILGRHGADLYINGHDHLLGHWESAGRHYVCCGGGSKMDDACDVGHGDFCSLRSGFTAFRLSRRGIEAIYRDYTGAELHLARIERPHAKAA